MIENIRYTLSFTNIDKQYLHPFPFLLLTHKFATKIKPHKTFPPMRIRHLREEVALKFNLTPIQSYFIFFLSLSPDQERGKWEENGRIRVKGGRKRKETTRFIGSSEFFHDCVPPCTINRRHGRRFGRKSSFLEN